MPSSHRLPSARSRALVLSLALASLRCGGEDTSTGELPPAAGGQAGAGSPGNGGKAGSSGNSGQSGAAGQGGSSAGGQAGAGQSGAAGQGGISGNSGQSGAAGDAGAGGSSAGQGGSAGDAGAGGSAQGGEGQGGSGQAGGSQAGSAQAGSGQAGEGQSGAGSAGESQGGAGQGSNGQAGAGAGDAGQAGAAGVSGAGASGASGAGAGGGGAGAGGVGAGGAGGQGGSGGACNGSPAYCARPYNQVAQACTHNAMSSTTYQFTIPTPNQKRSITQQLDEGVRCLMLDTYEYMGQPYFCHGACGPWGALSMKKGLQEINAWLEAHPGDIVTFILESYLPEDKTLKALVDAGLAAPGGQANAAFPLYFHELPPGSPWPTLGQMIASNQRLVVFTDDGNAKGSWHLDWRKYGWETHYDDPTFSCKDNRGDPTDYDNQVFILNHFTTGSVGSVEADAAKNNAFDLLLDHGLRCWQKDASYNPWAQIPTFVTVDHYHTPAGGGPTGRPDVLDVVEALNAAWPGPPPP